VALSIAAISRDPMMLSGFLKVVTMEGRSGHQRESFGLENFAGCIDG